MKPAIKKKWLTALRSGKFRKGTGTLKRHYQTQPAHCCLGVLCEVIKKDFAHAGEVLEPNAESTLRTKFSMAGMLNPRLMEYTKITQEQQRTLATKNDNGWSFEKIANYIEAKL